MKFVFFKCMGIMNICIGVNLRYYKFKGILVQISIVIKIEGKLNELLIVKIILFFIKNVVNEIGRCFLLVKVISLNVLYENLCDVKC